LPASDEHGSPEVVCSQRSYGFEHAFPSTLPPVHNLRTSCTGINLELLVAMAVGFFSVAGQKICPAGAHVSRHMFYKHCDAVRFGIDQAKNIFIAGLGEGLFSKLLIAAKIAQCVG